MVDLIYNFQSSWYQCHPSISGSPFINNYKINLMVTWWFSSGARRYALYMLLFAEFVIAWVPGSCVLDTLVRVGSRDTQQAVAAKIINGPREKDTVGLVPPEIRRDSCGPVGQE